jgi:hypothetical protein
MEKLSLAIELREVRILQSFNEEISPEEILKRGGQYPGHWRYHAAGPRKIPHVLKVYIAVLKEVRMIEEIVMSQIEYRNVTLVGAGAWVREIWLSHFPHYDYAGPILFPGKDSLWEDECDPRGGICTTGAWHDGGRVGPRSLDWLGDQWRAGRRIAFVEA